MPQLQLENAVKTAVFSWGVEAFMRLGQQIRSWVTALNCSLVLAFFRTIVNSISPTSLLFFPSFEQEVPMVRNICDHMLLQGLFTGASVGVAAVGSRPIQNILKH